MSVAWTTEAGDGTPGARAAAVPVIPRHTAPPAAITVILREIETGRNLHSCRAKGWPYVSRGMRTCAARAYLHPLPATFASDCGLGTGQGARPLNHGHHADRVLPGVEDAK